MLFSALTNLLHADEPFPGEITAAVEGQLVRLYHLFDQIVDRLVDLLFAGPFRETPGDGEASLLKLDDMHFFTQTPATILGHYFTLSNIKSHTPWPRRWPRCSNLVTGRDSGRGT